MRRVVETSRRVTAEKEGESTKLSPRFQLHKECFYLLQEVMKRGHAAVGPLEALLRVPEVAHDVTVLPAALLRTGSTEVARGWRTVVNGAQSGENKRSDEWLDRLGA